MLKAAGRGSGRTRKRPREPAELARGGLTVTASSQLSPPAGPPGVLGWHLPEGLFTPGAGRG